MFGVSMRMEHLYGDYKGVLLAMGLGFGVYSPTSGLCAPISPGGGGSFSTFLPTVSVSDLL